MVTAVDAAVMVMMMVMMMRVEAGHARHSGHSGHVVQEISLTLRTLFGVEEGLGEGIVLDLQGGDLRVDTGSGGGEKEGNCHESGEIACTVAGQ